jgi:hypothetical protein
MTAISPGPARIPGSSSPYPDDDSPALIGLRGQPRRADYTRTSLHLKSDCPHVCWQLPSHEKGPYGGNHDRFIKFQYKLPSDATMELMLTFNFLRTQFQATGFQNGLVPDIGKVHSNVDLTKSPVDHTYKSNRGRPEWSTRAHWVNAHKELGFSVHRVLTVVARDSFATAPVFAQVVSDHSYAGNGFAVLNELLRLHFPHVDGTRAPSFDTAAAQCILQGSSEAVPKCERQFTLWVQSLSLYREFGRYQDSEVTMWFVNGLLAWHRLFLDQEYVDLKQSHSVHRLAEDEPRLPDKIQRYFLCERLRLAHGDDSLYHPPKSTLLGAQVALHDGSHPDADPDPIADANVTAVREHRPHHNNHNNYRGLPNPQHSRGLPSSRGPPQSRGFGVLEKAVACGFSPCAGCSHPPNICCICDSPHHMSRCWHLLGLPPNRQTRLTAFK